MTNCALTPVHAFTMANPPEATKPLQIATAAGWVHIEPGTEITFEIRDGIWRVREP